MACQKLMLHYRNVHNLLHVNISSIALLNTKMNYLNTKQLTTPVFISIVRFNNNYANLDSLKNSLDLNEFKRLNFSGTKYIAQTLQKILDITLIESKNMIKTNPRLRKCSSDQIVLNYKLCQDHGITDETIKRFPNILSIEDLKIRLNRLKQLNIDLNKTAPLLLANFNILNRMVNDAINEEDKVPHGSRIIHLSKMLGLPEWEISNKLVHHNYIMRIPIERLEKVLKILLDYGVEPKNIMSDFWALRYRPELAERRLQRAIDSDVHKVKAWMIRCTDEVFERCINRQVENRKILGSDSSVEEYLSKRLECSIDNAKYLTDKYPAIEKMNISKMKEMMDFLFVQGYTPGHICRVPRILVHSLETTKSRLTQLKHFGYIPPSLALLCKSKKDYDKYILKYMKGNKNNNVQSEATKTQ